MLEPSANPAGKHDPTSDEEPDTTPRPNPILAQPATPALCQADYDEGADIRDRLGWKDAR